MLGEGVLFPGVGPERAAIAVEAAGAVNRLAAGTETTGAVGSYSAGVAADSPFAGEADISSASAWTWNRGRFSALDAFNYGRATAMTRVAS